MIENPVVNQEQLGRIRDKLSVMSTLFDRLQLSASLGQQFGGDRDMYEILGYPLMMGFADYLGKYTRQDVAGKVVDLPAIDTWRKPAIIEDGKSSTEQDDPISPFVRDLKAIINKRRLWHYLQRADRLSGIGRYGVLLIGVRGDIPMNQEIPAGALKGAGDVIYLSVFSESSAAIKSLDQDPKSERFGLPLAYDVKFTSGSPAQEVHWSRCIHLAEDLMEDEVYGRPRLERVYNLLEDLLKIVGGGAEATWKVMDQGMQANIQEGYTGESQTLDDLEEEIDEYLHGLRRFIRTQGVDIKQLGSQVVDPSGLFNIIISLVSAASGIPQRILIGSERGELASSQDAANWAGIIRARQTQFAEPMVLRPLIDRLITFGALAKPEGGYTVDWPSLFEMSDTQRSEVALNYSQAIAGIAPPGAAEAVVPIPEFREHFLGLPALSPEEAVLDEEDQQGDESE